MVQCSAIPMAMANSMARSFSTGSDPGNPRQTGQVLVFGSEPNEFAQPQNIFVAVFSSVWTSSPTTISQPFGNFTVDHH